MRDTQKIKYVVSIFIIICLLFTVIILPEEVGAVPLRERFTYGVDTDDPQEYFSGIQNPYYALMLDEYRQKGYEPADAEAVVINLEDAVLPQGYTIDSVLSSDIGGRETAFVWEKEIEWAEWEFEIAADGLYIIEVEYYMLPGSGNSATRSAVIDGDVPFLEANQIVFHRMWKDAGEPLVNSNGDEIRPRQLEIVEWRKVALRDGKGLYTSPFEFHFTPGKHTLRLEFIDQGIAIGEITIKPAVRLLSYSETEEFYREMGFVESDTEMIMIQAEENAVAKTSPTIRRESDADPMTVPESFLVRKLNVIGGWRWREGNQAVTWEIEVPEDGLYKIGMRVFQGYNDGLPVFRRIEINGSVPFKEMEQYGFIHKSRWRIEAFHDREGEPYLFYLKKGINTITMTGNSGGLSDIILSLNEDVLLLSKIIRDIMKITGPNPDPNYNYNLMRTIPTLQGDLESIVAGMQNKYDVVIELSEKLPAMASNFMTIKSQIEGMLKKPHTIPRRINDLNNAQSALGSWYQGLQNQPLLLDYFLVGRPDEKWSDTRASVFKRLRYTFANFFMSFRKDYDSVGSILQEEVEINTVIDVWVARGVEWAEVIKELADEDFTPKTGIAINLNVLPASQLQAGGINALMLSIVSGKAPDVGLGVDNPAAPVEFAIRDAVYDLSKFPDFEEVYDRFLPGIFIPYKYMGGVYALPETMNFNVLLYRQDIIGELGVLIPDTREELYNYTLPSIYQFGLQFHYPADFSQFIFQHGGSFYTEDGMKSGLDTPESYRAFKELTELYTHYGIPVVSNLFNRMRTGETPMGIGSFWDYMLLTVAAPELAGRWGIAPLPGKKLDDGTVDRSWGGLAGQSCVIMNQTKEPDASWEFIKWWTDAPTQTRFAREIEAIIGTEARWNTANIEAFDNLPWNREHLSVIHEMWEWARETPVVLGGYFTGRHLGNAWNRVIIGNQNIRDAIEEAVEDINRELRMKQEEYGFEAGH